MTELSYTLDLGRERGIVFAKLKSFTLGAAQKRKEFNALRRYVDQHKADYNVVRGPGDAVGLSIGFIEDGHRLEMTIYDHSENVRIVDGIAVSQSGADRMVEDYKSVVEAEETDVMPEVMERYLQHIRTNWEIQKRREGAVLS